MDLPQSADVALKIEEDEKQAVEDRSTLCFGAAQSYKIEDNRKQSVGYCSALSLRAMPHKKIEENQAAGYCHGLSLGVTHNKITCNLSSFDKICIGVPRKHRTLRADKESGYFIPSSIAKKQKTLGINLPLSEQPSAESSSIESILDPEQLVVADDNDEENVIESSVTDCSNERVIAKSASEISPHTHSKNSLVSSNESYQCCQSSSLIFNGSDGYPQSSLTKTSESNSQLNYSGIKEVDKSPRFARSSIPNGRKVVGTETELTESDVFCNDPNSLSDHGVSLPAELPVRYRSLFSESLMHTSTAKAQGVGEKYLEILTSPPTPEEISETGKLQLYPNICAEKILPLTIKRQGLSIDCSYSTKELKGLQRIKTPPKLSLKSINLHEESEQFESINARCYLEKSMMQARPTLLTTSILKRCQVNSRGIPTLRHTGSSRTNNSEDHLSFQGTIDADGSTHKAGDVLKNLNLHFMNEDPGRCAGLTPMVDEPLIEENALSDRKTGKRSLGEDSNSFDLKQNGNSESRQTPSHEIMLQEDSCSVVDLPTDTFYCQSDADNGFRYSTVHTSKSDRASFSAMPQMSSPNHFHPYFAKRLNYPFDKHKRVKTSDEDVKHDSLSLQEEHAESAVNLTHAVLLREDPDTPIDSDISYNSQQSENLKPLPKKNDDNVHALRGGPYVMSENYSYLELAPGEVDSSTSPDFQTLEAMKNKEMVETLVDSSGRMHQNLYDSVKERTKRLPISAQIQKRVPPTSAKSLLATGLLEGKYVRYIARGGEVLRLGVVKDGAILCQCNDCKGQHVFNVSGFERHAGSNARHPSDYIFLENGISLKEIIEVGMRVKETGEALVTIQAAIADGTDRHVCAKCHKSGAVLHCACRSCLRIYHQECVGLATFPEGNWICPECLKMDVLEPLLDKNASQRRSINHMESGLQPKTRDPSLHKALFLPGGLPDGARLGYYDKGKCLLTGTKEGSGICCSCCNRIVSCSQFEVHAGWGARRNPYNCIHLLDGMSLHEVAVQRWNMKSSECGDGTLAPGTSHNDCLKCGLDGELVQCHNCSRAYHPGCIGLPQTSHGSWSCTQCTNRKVSRLTKVQEGLLKGRERSQGRCKRIVKAAESIASGCALCKCGDFTKSGFDERTVLLCDQCEKEFHVGCLKAHGMEDLKELPQGEWFCGKDCHHIHQILHLLVLNGPELVPGGIASKVVAKLQEGIEDSSNDSASVNLTWQILHGKRKKAHPQDEILDDVMTIFSECFEPIVDAVSGQDLIPLMVYSQTRGEQEFGGMHCIVLKQNEEVLSACIIRIFGKQLAEMPLVATRLKRRSLGCCEALLQCVERLLGILQVKQILLPAAEGAEGIWQNKFGFCQMPQMQLKDLQSQFQMMIFSGSSMMQKAISPPVKVFRG